MSYSYLARTPLHAAAYSGNVSGLQLVIDQGAEVNSVDQRGCSALMVAAERGQTTAVGVWKKRGKAQDFVLSTQFYFRIFIFYITFI